MMLDVGCVLLLEDEPFIAIDLEETLTEAGARSVISLGSIVDALEWLKSNSPDMAVLDPHLRDGTCSAVAAALVERGIPFLVHSGDMQSVLEAGSPFAFGEWVSKPSMPENLIGKCRLALAHRDSTCKSKPRFFSPPHILSNHPDS